MVFFCSMILGERQSLVLLILVEQVTITVLMMLEFIYMFSPTLHLFCIVFSQYSYCIQILCQTCITCPTDYYEFVPFDRSSTTGSTSGAGTSYPSEAPQFTSCVKRSFLGSIFSFLCSALWITVYHVDPFLVAILFSVLLRFTALITPLISYLNLIQPTIFFRNTCTKSGSLRFSQYSGC